MDQRHVARGQVAFPSDTPFALDPRTITENHAFERRQDLQLSIVEHVHSVKPGSRAIHEDGPGSHDEAGGRSAQFDCVGKVRADVHVPQDPSNLPLRQQIPQLLR